MIEYLDPGRGGVFVDATLGLGGHAEALLEAAPDALLVGIDRDPQARAIAAERLERFGERVSIVAGNFADLGTILAARGQRKVAGILVDLGVSSLQLDRPERGFSFRLEGPLDMRMNPDGPSAADVVDSYSEERLERIFREYGEERQARRVARAVVAARANAPIVTTHDLRRIISAAKGGRSRREGRVDPATRVFQALRIEVNQELAGLERLLDQAVTLLDQDGRLIIISYHSLEDRIVKHTLRNLARGEVDPITGRTRSETRAIELLTGKPVRPSPAEIEANPRARSARLRAARRL